MKKVAMKLRVVAFAVFCAVAVVPLGAQGGLRGRGAGRAGAAAGNGGITPAEIQGMFDAYALLQAQQQIGISDEQYPQFLVRFKALQDARRQALQEHTRIVLDLARMLRSGQADEAQLKERLQALADADARGVAETTKASTALDAVLDVKQQAQFRVFEELMERRKLELITRARQANRQRRQP
jgi:hypothetical protein